MRKRSGFKFTEHLRIDFSIHFQRAVILLNVTRAGINKIKLISLSILLISINNR